MSTVRNVAVIDIGKTNAKLALVDLHALTEVKARRMPNRVIDGPYPHYDVEGLWSFILGSLAELSAERAIDAISVATHGATAALLDGDGGLALPVLDYEHDGPGDLTDEYNTLRPAFLDTGSPPLPLGLNLGAQLYWQSRAFPEAFDAVRQILTYPQYWAFRLTGVAASEVTSLGCHTDLWNPERARFSSLVESMGWRELFPPLSGARERLATLRPEIARQTGLPPETPVFCGIHDSNASLLPHLIARRPPFAVVSTGTWVINMAIGGKKVSLDPARDTLVNADAEGRPVPSARFMGGREYEILTGGEDVSFDEDDVAAVLSDEIMLLPSVQPGCGPFPDARMRWVGAEAGSAGRRSVAASFYLSMMTATCLNLIGADGDIVVEGPLALNRLLLEMLQATTGRPVLPQEGNATGTSIGAAMLSSGPDFVPELQEAGVEWRGEAWKAYARKWRAMCADM